MTNSRLNLWNLQEEIATTELSAQLDKQSIGRLRQTSKKMNRLFQEPSKVAKLLQFVQEADYVGARNALALNPSLMFKTVSYKKADGSYEAISPLKLSFKLLDTYMWRMFLGTILGAQCHLLDALPIKIEYYKNYFILVSGQLFAINPDGKAELVPIQRFKTFRIFHEQLSEQHERVNLESLFDSYKDYKIKSAIPYLSYHLLNKAWLNVGKKQRELLPRHMLKEFCRKSNSWDITAPFKAINPPVDLIYSNLPSEETLLFIPEQGLGYHFSLLRSWEQQRPVKISSPPVPNTRNIEHLDTDEQTFRHLYKVRLEDLKKLEIQMRLLSQNTQYKMK